VSIGLPVYNGEDYLEEALESIAAQTHRNYEVVISDNASISHLIVHDGRWYVRRYNDTTHLHAGFTTAPEPMT